jgi:predicted flap endonuclease-1-like 5' DNA nuclease
MGFNDPINTPSLSGWVIAAALGALLGVVSYVQLGLGANGSVLVAGLVTVVVGLIIGLPSSDVPAVRPAAVAHPVVPPLAPAPVAEPTVALVQPVEEPAAVFLAAEAAEKPRTLAAARDGRPDDLKLIRGVGPKMEAMLHRMGFFHFDQVAAWTPAELAWVDDNLEGFRGRASRDEWVAQARVLAAGGRPLP